MSEQKSPPTIQQPSAALETSLGPIGTRAAVPQSPPSTLCQVSRWWSPLWGVSASGAVLQRREGAAATSAPTGARTESVRVPYGSHSPFCSLISFPLHCDYLS
jgi:hypothetical protein